MQFKGCQIELCMDAQASMPSWLFRRRPTPFVQESSVILHNEQPIISITPLRKYCVLATYNQSALFDEIEIVDRDALG